MDIVQIVVIGLVATVLALTLKGQAPEFALVVSIAASVLIFFAILPGLATVVQSLVGMAEQANANMAYIGIVMKIVGIATLAEFGAQICADAGESAIAAKIEVGGKVLIMVISLPILGSLIDLIARILP